MIRSWISIWRDSEKPDSRGSHIRRRGRKVALECLEQRLPLSLSHTVAPFAESTPTVIPVQVAPYQRHAEIAVTSVAGNDLAGQNN